MATAHCPKHMSHGIHRMYGTDTKEVPWVSRDPDSYRDRAFCERYVFRTDHRRLSVFSASLFL